MAKRKTKSGIFRKTKRIHTPQGESFRIQKLGKRLPRSQYARISTSRIHHKKVFQKKIQPEFEKLYRKSVSQGDKHIFRVSLNHNLKGKRVEGGFSLRRKRIKSLKEFRRAMEEFEKAFIESLEKYLARKDYNSVSIRTIEVETVLREKRKKKKRSKAKRKTHSARRQPKKNPKAVSRRRRKKRR